MDCYCDYDPPQFCKTKRQTARKDHKCGECFRLIKPGESYEYMAGMWDGIFSTHRTCSHCLDIRQFVKNSVPCFCWAYGSLHDDARDTIEDAYWRAGEEVKGLFMAYGRLVIAGRRARKEAR